MLVYYGCVLLADFDGLGLVLVCYGRGLAEGLLFYRGGVLLRGLTHPPTVLNRLRDLLAETVLLHVFLVVSTALRS